MRFSPKLLPFAAALLILLFGLSIWKILANNHTGTLTLTVVPSDSVIVVDDKTKAHTGTIRLAAGKHSFKISHDSFQDTNFTVDIAPGRAQTKQLTLSPNSASSGQAWAQAHPDQATQAEGIAGATANSTGQTLTNNNPLIARLPYVGSDFRIDFGVSQQHPDDPNAVAVYITPDSADGKQYALDWIRAQGFDPNAYEIIYNQTYDD